MKHGCSSQCGYFDTGIDRFDNLSILNAICESSSELSCVGGGGLTCDGITVLLLGEEQDTLCMKNVSSQKSVKKAFALVENRYE